MVVCQLWVGVGGVAVGFVCCSPFCPHLPGHPGSELLAEEQSVRETEPKDLTDTVTAGEEGGGFSTRKDVS